MMKLKIILPMLIAVGLTVGCHSGLSRERILQIANDLAIREGFEPRGMNTVYDADNKRWFEHQRIMSQSSEMVSQFSALRNNGYQAVGYFPKEQMLGGVLWVFIDKKTGEIITFFGEE